MQSASTENMEKGPYDSKEQVRTAVGMFATISSASKEEAFLKGYLMALGHKDPECDYELIARNPELFIPIKKE